MNTQTHILVATALLLPYSGQLLPHQGKFPLGVKAITLAAIVGAVAPDASLFFMWGLAKFQGVPENIIWNDWYFSARWQNLGALTNSIPVFILLTVVAFLCTKLIQKPHVSLVQFLKAIQIAAIAALVHTFCDFPLHHDDGHPHFWPLSSWIFSSPVSYWDPNHYGSYWSFIELLIAAVLIGFLWRKYANRTGKVTLGVVAASYFAMTWFWLNAF